VILLGANFQAGPPVRLVASGFPLVTQLGGTSVRVASAGGAPVDAFILATEFHFVRALLPSNTPIGPADLVVSYNGQVGGKTRIQVVKSQFGIYTEEYAAFPFGEARRTVQNVSASGDVTVNSYLNPARPGQPVVLWGTGLGAAPGDETAGLPAVDLQIPVLQVILGGKALGRVLYAGRAGCCAGIDVVIFETPAGIEGCNVPVWVRSVVGDDLVGSNEAKISIASRGPCADPNGLLIESEMQSPNLRAAQIAALSDSWQVAFGSAAGTSGEIAFGTCTNEGGRGSSLGLKASLTLDAGGTLDLDTPRQTLRAERRNGIYYAPFDGRLDPGNYSIDTGHGGPDVGSLHVSFSPVSPDISWTHTDNDTDASQPVGIQWLADGGGYVIIAGRFEIDGETYGDFYCVERAAAGEFVVNSSSYQRAKAGIGTGGLLHLYVYRRLSKRIEVPGFNLGTLTFFSPVQEKIIPVK
jgi:uncharacterized protein (TIGR03437 family)